MNERDFLVFGEGIASKVSEGINYVFGNTYPKKINELATIAYHSCVKKYKNQIDYLLGKKFKYGIL